MDAKKLAQALRDATQSASNSVASNVSFPVDAMAWALRKAGMPIPEAPFMGSDWMAQKGFTRPVQQGAASILGETAGMIAPMAIAAKAPQIAGGLLKMGENAIAPQVLRKESGMFIGPSAKTWDAEAASKAQQLAAKGVEPRAIWSETGTWKGPDGMWRQEIPDNKSFYVGSKAGGGSYSDDVLLHPELYKSYPNTAKSRVIESPLEGGNFDPVSRKITVGPRDAGSTMIHEQQHQIQELEGFAKGGSPRMMGDEMGTLKQLNDEFNTAFSQYMNPVDEIQRGNARQTMDYLQKKIAPLKDLRGVLAPEEAYARLAGEAEARATQARMPLDATQRRALFPEDSYDVPLNQLIVRGLLDKQSNNLGKMGQQ